MLSFEKLTGYKKALDFADKIYTITDDFPKHELFGVVSQIRRAALSISLNIAEGVGRYNNPERKQFYRVARSSAYECIPLLEISKRREYIKSLAFDETKSDCVELTKILSGLIGSL